MIIKETKPNQEIITRKLNSIGKKIFVEYFNVFKSNFLGNLSKEQTINIFTSKKISNYNGANIRYSNAMWLFKYQKEKDALKIVIDSKRVPQNIKNKAQNILNTLQEQ